jgi:hypothetical protein
MLGKGAIDPSPFVSPEEGKSMPYTDLELAKKMKELLIAHAVISKEEYKALKAKHTEVDVRALLKPARVGAVGGAAPSAHFTAYWQALGAWLGTVGGNLATLDKNMGGRGGANKTAKMTAIPLYNDAFHDVTTFITQATFSEAKAIANHMRFICVIKETEKDMD